MEYQRDEHLIHLVVYHLIWCPRRRKRVFPSTSTSDMVKQIKGFTAHEVRQLFPQRKTMPSMWRRSYFASTAANVSAAIIRDSIAAQKGI